jgi:hypothetical protein
MADPDKIADSIAELFFEEEFDNARTAIKDAISDAFDLGYKAAGGSIVPDIPKGFALVEIALDRDEIDAISIAAEEILTPRGRSVDDQQIAALEKFLETISIFRRKR